MPILISEYTPPFFFRNNHLQTIYPSRYRVSDPSLYRRERLELDDGDFLDLDWSCQSSDKIVIISHGLEGDSHRPYSVNMARAMNGAGMDAVVWNFRGCSGEPNRLLRAYHNGATDDLHAVVEHVLGTARYKEVYFMGFSMGGNIALNYLGGLGGFMIPKEVKKAFCLSVPCDLTGSGKVLARWSNVLYMKRFIRKLHKKIIAKTKLFPDKINDIGYKKIKNFKHFDDRYTAPIHGFESAEDYWEKCSAIYYLENITVPTLIVSAVDDPFLSESCYPVEIAEKSKSLFLEMPKHGGHVGFIERNGEYWAEKRVLEFFAD